MSLSKMMRKMRIKDNLSCMIRLWTSSSSSSSSSSSLFGDHCGGGGVGIYHQQHHRRRYLHTSSVQNVKFSTFAMFDVKPYKLHRMDDGPDTAVQLEPEHALKYYREMSTIRRLEMAANQLYKERYVRGFCHLYSGQEAVCVGIENAITKKDAVITAYRAHGWTYIRGVSLVGVLAELTGRSTGCARGKGGSMHMYHERFYGGNGIVGAQMPLGAGIALAQKYTQSGEVTIALCGDGAANQGQVFEVYNMSALWQLPVIFVTENNGYGMGTAACRSSASTDYYKRGDYIPGLWIDGMDVLAVRNGIEYLVAECRAGRGPFVVEMATYRYHGHSVSDPGTSYRTREEIAEVRSKRDPITQFRERIIEAEFATAEQLKRLDAEIRAEVDDAMQHAKMDAELAPEELYNDVYVSPASGAVPIRGVTPFDAPQHQNTGKVINLQ